MGQKLAGASIPTSSFRPVFCCRHKVGFAHCDPAGIVFYPRYFEMVNATVEEWFETALDFSFAKIHGDMVAAVPIAAINIDFRHPSRLGDVLEFRLYVTRLGRSSIDLQITAAPADAPDGTDRFTMTSTLVFTRKDIAGSAPWPADLRTALQHHINKQDQHDT